MKIAVLGGGMSGITVARQLQEKNHEVHLFEARSELGGLCRSRIVDGFVYDLGGGHIVNSKNNKILNLILDELGQDLWYKHERNAKIFFKGSYVKYPFENGLDDLPKEDNFECLLGYINAHFDRKFLRKSAPHNFYDWILYRFGIGIAEAYMIPYNQKVWNYNLKHMGTNWIDERVPLAQVEDVIKASIGIATEGHKHQSQFYYPKKGGFQTVVDAFAKPLETIHLSSPVVSLENSKGKWIINGFEEFDDVISTLPMQDLPKIVSNIPPFVSATLDSIWYNGVVTVLIGLKKPFNHNYSWLFLPNKENGPSHRLTFMSNYSEFNAPKGCSSIIAEITYKAKTIPEREDIVVSDLIKFLHNSEIIDKEDIIVTDSTFFKYAYPVYGLKFHEFTRIINNYLNEIKLKSFGRFASHSYWNIDRIVEESIMFVDQWY
ncbi:MAG: FAD-dependent oxidoreductase [Cyanobacteriota bacterium]